MVTLGQKEVRHTERTSQQLSSTQYRYLDSMRAIGGSVGQRMSRPRPHQLLANGLFDSETRDEDPEL